MPPPIPAKRDCELPQPPTGTSGASRKLNVMRPCWTRAHQLAYGTWPLSRERAAEMLHEARQNELERPGPRGGAGDEPSGAPAVIHRSGRGHPLPPAWYETLRRGGECAYLLPQTPASAAWRLAGRKTLTPPSRRDDPARTARRILIAIRSPNMAEASRAQSVSTSSEGTRWGYPGTDDKRRRPPVPYPAVGPHPTPY